MSEDEPFVDYYSVLRVNPNCNARTLENAYHSLAKTYHPDHGDTADVAKLTEVIEAYKALKSPERRAEYDLVFATNTGFVFSAAEDELAGEKAAISDADQHTQILLTLYQKRREDAQNPGVGRYHVQQMLNCSDETFEFHLWYLKEKGLILTTEQGTLAITIVGVDHVISLSRTVMKEKLMISHSDDSSNREQS